MGIIKHVRSVFPIPKAWEHDDDRKNFAMRVETAIRELFARRVVKVKVNGAAYGPANDDTVDLGELARPDDVPKRKRYFAAKSNATITHEFTTNSPFLLLITRAATSYSSMVGLYAGNASSSNANVRALVAPTTNTPPTVSISNRTLTVVTTATNTNVTVIDLY